MSSFRLVFLVIAAFLMIELASSSPVQLPHNSKRSLDLGGPGITYSPIKGTPGATSCKTSEEVEADISRLTGYSLIRLYGCDCDQVKKVLAAARPRGIRLFVGITQVDDLQNQINSLYDQVGHKWDNIITVAIGNELVLQGKKTARQMVDLTNQARTLLRAKGYQGPVVHVEVFYQYLQDPTLCEGSDYIACNGHAYFDGHVEPQNSGSFLTEMVKQVQAKCGKDVMITETGWPTQGGANGIAVPSKENQKLALDSIRNCPISKRVIFFTAFNDMWKADTASTNGAERYWGIVS